MRVAYRDDPAIGITVTLIRSWRRGEIAPVYGTSGLKDYLRNDVWTVFNRIPAAAKVVLLRGVYLRSVPFLLIQNAGGRFFDMTAREVLLES
jgi:hypothetical protein